MKNLTRWIGLTALVAVSALVMAACVIYDEEEYVQSLSQLIGTWKEDRQESSHVKIKNTAVFSNVNGDTIDMKLVSRVADSTNLKSTSHSTGSVFLDTIFGLSGKPTYSGGKLIETTWERTYTLAEVQELQWELITAGKKRKVTLEIIWLIPERNCDCDDCTHTGCSEGNSCIMSNCVAKTRGYINARLEKQ